jgi:N-acetylmuramoyl-L-alanine amidase
LAVALGSWVAANAVAQTTKSLTVLLDPGHTLVSPGALGARAIREVNYNNVFVGELSEKIKSAGHKVILTRASDEEISLDKRAEIANASGADLFLSIHHDSAQIIYLEQLVVDGKPAWRSKSPIRGYSVFISALNPLYEKSMALGKAIAAGLKSLGRDPTLHHAEKIAGESRELLDAKLGLYRFDELLVLRKTKIPAVLLEVGVIVDDQDEAYVASKINRAAMIDEIVKALGKSLTIGPTAVPTVLPTVAPTIVPNTVQAFLLCKSQSFNSDYSDNNDNRGCMLVDTAGKRLTPELFDTPDGQPQNGMIRTKKIVYNESGSDWRWVYGYMSIFGKPMLPTDDTGAVKSPSPRKLASTHELSAFSDGLALVCDSRLGCGYLAPDGTWAIPPNPNWASDYNAHDFHHGLALVRGPGFVTDPGPMSGIGPMRIRPPWSVIDKTGRIVMGYDPATEKNLINPSKAERVIGQRYCCTRPDVDIQSDFIDGVAAFTPGIPYGIAHNMGMGLVDTKGKIVVQPNTKDHHEQVLRDKYFPKEDRKPSAALNKKFCLQSDFYEGLALAYKSCRGRNNGQWSGISGFINRQGQWVIKPFDFQSVQVPFRDGHAVIEIYEPELMTSPNVLIDRTGRNVANYRKLLKPTDIVEK